MAQQKTEQMSESMLVGVLLIIAGGYLDAYTYCCRGEVFANAQTGNIVLLGVSLTQGDWAMVLQYALPIAVFAFGIYIAERLRWTWRERKDIHWRQIILLIEIIILFGASFLGEELNWLVNVMVSFVCALQMESFRKIRGNAYVTTMCTGNLRSAAEQMCNYQRMGDEAFRKRSIIYYLLVFAFAFGALLGGAATGWLGYKALLIDLIPLILCFLLMFREEG